MYCENCKNVHDGTFASGRFCSKTCSRSFASKQNRDETNLKVSKKLSGRKLSREHKEKIVRFVDKHERNCLGCNLVFIASEKNTRKFCSFDCWREFVRRTKSEFQLYALECKFKFNIYDFPQKFNLRLIENFGWYSPTENKNGISRDHMFSIRDGFDKKIDSVKISHPANCLLVRHKENQKKRTKSSISIDELESKICSWTSN